MADQKALGPNLAATRMEEPFTAWDIIRPHLDASGGPWTWTHYGVYIPNLPEPFGYLNVLILFGAVDLTIFKHPKYMPDGPQPAVQNAAQLTTVMSSTAAQGHHFDKGYDSVSECRLPDSGTPLRWGEDLSIAFDYQRQTAVVEADFHQNNHQWSYKLDVTFGETAVWFISTPYYDHLSLPVRGTLNIAGQAIPITGALEFARCKPAPIPLKMHNAVAASTNYFIYHVVELDNGMQILWGEVRNAFMPPRKFVHVRRVPDGQVIESFTTELQVEVLKEEMVTSNAGQVTRMPCEFRAGVVREGETVLEILGKVNTPLRDGAGGGYVAGYSAAVKYRAEQRKGWGMFEWVDLELQRENGRARL
ncbi:hypothetical protein QQS21_010516 [Conoideocrella luteorostrata]|uniref:Uncharacterized protein n=1 Tax=Conoideocrella luteorostrata TaxID=1105319 RepID=A0AAJ0CEV2_9HYPO|nr:hypothetical protein QQS21_010516 [Conoideocrella luteorostrata]